MQARRIVLVSVLVPVLVVGLLGASKVFGEEPAQTVPTAASPVAAVPPSPGSAAPAPTVAAPAPAPANAELAARVADLEAYINNTPPKRLTSPGPGHNGWMMTSLRARALHDPAGPALFYGGLVRSKNVLSVVAQCFGCAGLVTILWWAFGYSFVFAAGFGRVPRSGSMKFAFLKGVTRRPTPTTRPGSRRTCSPCTS